MDVMARIKKEIVALEARVDELEKNKSDDSYRKGVIVGHNNGLENAAIEAERYGVPSLAANIRTLKVP